jgi:hypothetical protein
MWGRRGKRKGEQRETKNNSLSLSLFIFLTWGRKEGGGGWRRVGGSLEE